MFGEGFGRFEVGGRARRVEDLLGADFESRFKLELKSAHVPIFHGDITGLCTIGMISAGSLLRRWASCSLNTMRWAMSMSQKYCFDSTFSRI